MALDYSVCLDIGGTKVLGAIFDKEGKPVYRLKKKTKSGGDSSVHYPCSPLACLSISSTTIS